MKIGTCIFSLPKLLGRERAYELIKGAGFDAIDHTAPMTEYQPFSGLFALPEKDFAREFVSDAEALNKAGLTCSQVHVPFPTYPERKQGINQAEEFAFMKSAIKKSFRAAREVGAPYCVLHPVMRCGWNRDDNPELTFRMNVELYAELLNEAKKQGVKIALENMPNAWIPTATPESLIALIDAMGDEDFVACLDTGHALITKTPLADFVRALGSRLKVLHVHDNDGIKDQHAMPFTGVADWQAFATALREVGFQGTLSLEALFDEKALLKSPLECLKQAKERAQKIVDMI